LDLVREFHDIRFLDQAKVETIVNNAYKYAVVNTFAEFISHVIDNRRNELDHSDLELEVTIHYLISRSSLYLI